MGVIVQDVFHKIELTKTAAATYKLAKSLEASKGYTVHVSDTVLRHRRARGDQRDREEDTG